ncbi:MAG: DUF4924 family protein [Bacteroidaceae bacterium]
MFIAKKLRETNIAEYLLYMWQVEDLIRAYDFSIDKLKDSYLSQFQLPKKQQEELEEWYSNIIKMMQSENVTAQGHIQINKNCILLLTDLHHQLINSTKYPFYSAAYYKTLPYIIELRRKGERTDLPEIENCLDMLYGVMMLRLQNKAIRKETEKAVQDVTTFIGMLSDYYLKDKKTPLEF